MSHANSSETPEFIRWALARPCLLRTNARWQNPEQTERQLRPLRVFSEAAGEGRLFDGICVAANAGAADGPAWGFRASELFAAYYEPPVIEATCGVCPANVVRTNGTQSLVGCFGWFEWSALGEQFYMLVDDALRQLDIVAEMRREFLGTCPTWYGLWAASPLSDAQLRLHAQLAAALSAHDERLAAALREWQLALHAAAEFSLPLHVTYSPRGQVDGPMWFVPAHCSRCKAPPPTNGDRCPVCGHFAFAQPRRRRAKGRRPYLPLESFLGPAASAEFLARYREFRRASSAAAANPLCDATGRD